MEEKLTQAELDERVAILRRFRTLLEQQRQKFRDYLKVLELQENKINEEDADALIAHTELETQIVSSIGSLQKVILPMQKLYNSSKAAVYNPQDAIPINSIQDDLERLQKQVLVQNERNRELLKTHISTIKNQLNELQNPYKNSRSVYSENHERGSMIMIEA